MTCSVKKVFLEIPQNSQENTCDRVSLLIKLHRPSTLLKKRLCYRCFPVNFAKFLRTPFFTEHLWWLLLYNLKRYVNMEKEKKRWRKNTKVRQLVKNVMSLIQNFSVSIFCICIHFPITYIYSLVQKQSPEGVPWKKRS